MTKAPKLTLKRPTVVRRYTSLSSVIDILRNCRITLLDPATWDDKNDAYMIELYRRHTGAVSVKALCCSTAKNETYHHWRIFTQGSEGVCVELDRAKLEAVLAKSEGVRFGLVEYKLIKSLDEDEEAAGLRDFPFFKREGFADEKEWRAIHIQKKSKGAVIPKAQYVTIPHDCIARIVINPWMAAPLFSAVKGVLSSIDGCGKVSILQSRLTNSSQWKEAADRLVGRYL